MERDPLESQGMSSQDSRTSKLDEESQSFAEDPQPSALRPQAMPTAEVPSMSPRIREQALPEKEDDRFFDRWVVDKARDLGARAVRRAALEKLKEAVDAFAQWRSLRHGPAAERENMNDRALVASTPARIKRAEAEADRLGKAADEVEERAGRCEVEMQETAEDLSGFRPALRGTDWDLLILLLANAVVFAVDIFIIHAALGRIPGNDREYWLTAITMGAGAVVVGDALGWMAGAGAIRKDGSIGRPGRSTVAAVAGLLILSIWFFVELGDFREFAIVAEARDNGVNLKDPSFFTIAQTVFLLASAVSCFAYVARRTGRGLLRQRLDLQKERDDYRAEAKTLREGVEQARRVAAKAPVLCEQAKKRIAARDRIAKGDAEHDLKQGEYLKALVDPEYMRERADVESGVRYWQFERGSEPDRTVLLDFVPAVVASLAAGGIAFWVVDSLFAAVITSAIVALAFFVTGDWDSAEEDGDEPVLERERQRKYIARLVASARKGKDRAGDIEGLVPFPPATPPDQSVKSNADNGGKGGSRRLTKEEKAKMKKTTILYRDEG